MPCSRPLVFWLASGLLFCQAATVNLTWESYLEFTNYNEQTGIESSTNLVTWQVETQFTLVTLTNHWTDTNPSPLKFYRAFNRVP